MALLLPLVSPIEIPNTGKWRSCRLINCALNGKRKAQFQTNSCIAMCTSSSSMMSKKLVWLWTENKQVMTTAVERGWNTFVFSSRSRDLANEWSSIALIYPLFYRRGRAF
ncbi:hypothetical protein F0562_005047 [Nyssa sinensis]|uniref:3-dehydroquinate synthase N-terminal domain-containing protein n=1 Tax=Nyssa sinensis TaxID=561372 RepID=A0A5J5AJH1_9ASTE|nr:hypothetical protein F0562_005047 [Nyssa sinensis]